MRAGAAAAACIATLLAGCGGSGSASGGGGDSWAERADAICAETAARIRERPAAKDPADLGRLMTAVVDDLKAGRSELKELELPADERKKAEPFLRDVDKVVDAAEKIRDAGDDHVKVWMTAYEQRVTALDLQDDGQAAGLKRCGADLSTKGVDAVMMPGYAQDVAVYIAPILATIEAAERMPTPGHGAAYWKTISAITDPGGTGRDPESLSDLETEFTQPLADAQYTVRDLLNHYDGTVRVPAEELRQKERRLHAVVRRSPAKAYELLDATGPAGKALRPRVERAVRKLSRKVG